MGRGSAYISYMMDRWDEPTSLRQRYTDNYVCTPQAEVASHRPCGLHRELCKLRANTSAYSVTYVYTENQPTPQLVYMLTQIFSFGRMT